MLARGLWTTNRDRNLTVLSIHPGWVRTIMGTLDGTVEPEMELEPSVRGVAEEFKQYRGSGENRYLDWRASRLTGEARVAMLDVTIPRVEAERKNTTAARYTGDEIPVTGA